MQEELTFPGEDPGIFACDYKKLARIAVAMGRSRLALARKDLPAAEVPSLSSCPSHCTASSLGLVRSQSQLSPSCP